MLKKLSGRVVISSLVVLLGLIIAAVPENTTKPYKLSPDQLLEEIKSGTQFIQPDQVADMLINEDPYLRLIDVRSPQEYDQFHLQDAINIPLDDILSDEYIDIMDQDIFFNVIYSTGTTKANEAWMLARQLGYRNNYVLLGGLNYWVETIINPSPPASTSPDDEIARYNFRQGAGQALGGSVVEENKTANEGSVAKPLIIPKQKKKKVASGGCS